MKDNSTNLSRDRNNIDECETQCMLIRYLDIYILYLNSKSHLLKAFEKPKIFFQCLMFRRLHSHFTTLWTWGCTQDHQKEKSEWWAVPTSANVPWRCDHRMRCLINDLCSRSRIGFWLLSVNIDFTWIKRLDYCHIIFIIRWSNFNFNYF